LDSVIADSIESVKQAAMGKGIKLDVELPEGISPVRGDREKLTPVITNLLTNAIKFTPRSGEISIKAVFSS